MTADALGITFTELQDAVLNAVDCTTMVQAGGCTNFSTWNYPRYVSNNQTERFDSSQPKPLNKLIHSSIPSKTREKALWAYRIYDEWQTWVLNRNISTRQPHQEALTNCTLLDMSEDALDNVLSAFIQQLKTSKVKATFLKHCMKS